jgi:hypothetical protein
MKETSKLTDPEPKIKPIHLKKTHLNRNKMTKEG